MAPPPPILESVLQLGFRFEPTPRDAVTYYLPLLIAGKPMHAAIRPFIHAADVYACEPGVLAAQFRPTPRTGDRFFFTTCKLQPVKAGKSSRAVRAAGPCGSWHSQGNSTDVKNAMGAKIGEVKKLRYKKSGVFTDWLMDEFSSCSSVDGDRQYVLCKIYVSPRAPPDSAARQESDAFATEPPPLREEPVAAATNKRPAPPVAEPPNFKKTRVAAVPTPPAPMVQPQLPSTTSTSTPVPTRPVPVIPARHMTLQEPAPRHQASTAAPCSPVVAPDPFFKESSPAPATAQEDDDDDDDLIELIEGNLETAEEEAEDEAAAEAYDWLAPMLTSACKETGPFAAAVAWEQNLIMPIF